MNDREKSEIVRADILRILWERGDRPQELRSGDLKPEEFEDFLVPAAQWLEAEGFIRLGRYHESIRPPGFFSDASLTAKGEAVLQSKHLGTAQKIGNWLSAAFQDAMKDGTQEAIKQIPRLLWASIEALKSTNS